MKDKPNIIFIMSDQHNAKVMGHLGHPDVKTPNLDRLAESGVRFDNCITQNPICTPSRVSFLSGQYPHNHGYYGLSGPQPQGLPSILGHFRRAGYRTGAIGKIHCPEYWIEEDADVFKEVSSLFSIGGCPEYDAYLKAKGVFHDRDDDFYQEQEWGRGQSFDGRVSRLQYEDSAEAWIAGETIGFMEEAVSREQRFFAHASFPRPHEIYSPSEPFWSMYDEANITLPPNTEYDMSLKAPHVQRMVEYFKSAEWTLFEPRTYEAGRLRKQHGYLGLVTQTDHAVGTIMEWLERKGLEGETIVVYTTDHGDYACEHGLMEKAPGICSDAITRIPFIWRWSGHFQEGRAAKEIVETVDLSTTLCSLCGLEPMETSDGKDISSLLHGAHREIHTLGVTEFAWSRSIRRGDYRLVYYPKEMFAQEYPDGFGELYDLKEDPWEMKNLYFEQEHRPLIQDIEEEFLDWLILTTRVKTILPRIRYSSSQSITRYKNTVNRDGKIHPDQIRRMHQRGGRQDQNYL